MSTKEKRYVRSTNGICDVELSQIFKVKYFMAVEQNVARSCQLFLFLCRCLFRSVWCHCYSFLHFEGDSTL